MLILADNKQLSVADHRARVEKLEKAIFATGEGITLPVEHCFSNGTYMRKLLIPAGVVVTGKIHKRESMNIIAKGKAIAITDKGNHQVEAGDTFVTEPGVKKACYAIEDTVWINVLPWTGPEDAELVEREFTVDSYEALESEVKPCRLQ